MKSVIITFHIQLTVMTKPFLRNKQSILEFVKTCNTFLSFSGLKPNFTKCEVASIDFLKGVKMAACGMKSADLLSDAFIILGIHFPITKHFKKRLIL